MATELFSFTLRPAETHADLLRCCKVRGEAYGRLNPALRDPMSAPDDIDRLPSTMVFLCEDKGSGAVVGTMRVQITTRGETQLAIEKYVVPPPEIAAFGRGEITRLASIHEADPFVRVALWKAGYLYCMANQVRWLLMAVRRASLLREYFRMGATELYDDRRSIPLAYAGNLPHRILSLDLGSCEQAWRAMNHPLQPFMCATVHPDLHVFPSVDRVAPKDAVSLKVA